MSDDQLAAEYLKRLRRAARTMPRARRRELLDEITAHIAEARATGEVPLQRVLDDLGDPKDIAATGSTRKPLGVREIAAVILLPIGGFIFLAFMIIDEETTNDVRASAQALYNVVIFGIGITVIVLVWVRKFMRNMTGANLKDGTPAQATILRIWDTGTTINDNPVVGFLLPDHVDEYWQLTLRFLKIAREAWPAILAERGITDCSKCTERFEHADGSHQLSWQS
jgi:hypothetical protein